jgi:Spy/CpxP family protein refolding chaperone
MRKLREEMQQARQALREINPGDAKYDSSVNATAKQVGELSAKMVKESAVLRAKVWGELTPAQRSQLAEREARMKDRAKNIRERRGKRAGNDGEGRRIREIRIERQQRN